MNKFAIVRCKGMTKNTYSYYVIETSEPEVYVNNLVGELFEDGKIIQLFNTKKEAKNYLQSFSISY
jgi:hypothetical protein